MGRLAGDEDLSGAQSDGAGDCLAERRLAGPVLADQRVNLSRTKLAASSKPQAASVSLSPPAAPRPICSVACPAPSQPSAPERPGKKAPPPLVIPPTRS